MDRAAGNNRKRGREPAAAAADPSRKSGKKKIGTACPAHVVVDPYLIDDETDIETTATFRRPMSIFEFPWQKENLVMESDGWDLRDVFFSSLVDGCKAAIGVPGDRLSPSPAPLSLPDEADDGSGGVDCIWSCVLREPLSLRYVQ